ncbi:MAG: DUF4277 domain-containing protein [bacterium]|nr:DUF4277 domain-containing protein [bacterium]
MPDISPDAYFDDRLDDTLDALYKFGLDDLELIITRHMLDDFGSTVRSAHNDSG